MSKHCIFPVLLSLVVCSAHADDFDTVVRTVQTKCGNISNSLSGLKQMAGINTVITGVGTAAATGATVVGIVKASKDEELRKVLSSIDNSNHKPNPSEADVLTTYDKHIKEHGDIQTTQEKLTNQSKTLGNWRTGLMGGSTATNVAGAIIAGNNKVDVDLQTQIDECIKSVEDLKQSMGQARVEGIDITKADKIVTECDKWKNADMSVINDRAQGAMLSSIVGATTGVAGTVTSAIANTDETRQDTDKAKDLDTASNILAGGTTLASGVATVFNATQISAIKKILDIANNCEDALK